MSQSRNQTMQVDGSQGREPCTDYCFISSAGSLSARGHSIHIYCMNTDVEDTIQPVILSIGWVSKAGCSMSPCKSPQASSPWQCHALTMRMLKPGQQCRSP